MLKAIAVRYASGDEPLKTFDKVVLPHDERHLRRKTMTLTGGDRILVDLAEPVMLRTGDALVLEDGREVAIAAADEALHEVIAKNPVHLSELAWHIGNRHLAAAISADRILILRDHVIKAMLEGLGAAVRDVVAPFDPVRGAYAGHSHDSHDGHHHDHAHHGHHHDHDHHHHDHHHHGHHDHYGRGSHGPHD
jgi:urease accessory protein